MTTPNEAAEVVYARAAANLTPPIQFENEAFDAPDGRWVRVVVRTRARNRETLGPEGARRYFSQASVIAQCYDRADLGRAGADAVAREVIVAFEGRREAGLAFNDAIAREQGPDGRWYLVVVEVEFTYSETR